MNARRIIHRPDFLTVVTLRDFDPTNTFYETYGNDVYVCPNGDEATAEEAGLRLEAAERMSLDTGVSVRSIVRSKIERDPRWRDVDIVWDAGTV